MRRRSLIQLAAALPVMSAVHARAQPARLDAAQALVLTSLQATFSITSALAAGTGISVRNLPANGSPMDSLPRVLSRQSTEAFADATATVSLGKLWPQDPLYPAARMINLSVVNIDAAFPWTSGETGVSLIQEPADNAVWTKAASENPRPASRYIWMGLPNTIRMAELIGADLERILPSDAARVQANLAALADALRSLKAEYEERFAALEDVRVFSLANEFVYLFDDMGIFVDGWFTRQDLDWTATDYAGLSNHVKTHRIRAVVHKWEPDRRVAEAVAAGGAKLVILDAGDTEHSAPLSPDGYQTLMRRNLQALGEALKAS